jgi:hypothetical protein
MPATDKYSLVVESATRGEADLRRFEQSLNRVADVAERASRRTSDASRKAQQDNERFAASLKTSIQNPLQAAGEAAEAFVLRFGKAGAAGAALAASFGLAARQAFLFVKEQGDAAGGMIDFADKTGLSISQVDRLTQAAKIATVDIVGLQRAAKGIAEILYDTGGASEKAVSAFRKLDVRLIDSSGKARNFGQVLFESIEKLAKVKDATERMALATAILGRSAPELQPLLANFERFDEIVRRAGAGTRDELLKALDDAADRIEAWNARWNIFKGTLALVALEFARVGEYAEKASQGGFIGNALFAGALTAGAKTAAMIGPKPSAGKTTPFGPDASLMNPEAAERARRETDALRKRRAAAQMESAAGLEEAIKQIAEERKRLNFVLNAAENPALFRETEQKLKNLDAQEKSLREKIGRLRNPDAGVFVARGIDEANRSFGLSPFAPGKIPTLNRRAGLAGANTAPIIADTAAMAAEELEAARRVARMVEMQNDAIRGQEARARQRAIEAIQRQAEFQARLIALTAGPGGEADAAGKVAAIRLAALEREKQFNDDLFDIERRRAEVLQDAQLQALELQRRRVEEFRAGAGQIFDALVTRGRTGFLDLLRGQALNIGRTVFQNFASEMFGAAQGRLTLPGQRTSDGGVTVLGRLLAGTPFADQGMKTATDLNTAATIENTIALRAASAGVAGGGWSASAAGLPSTVFGGAGRNPLIFSSAPKAPASGGGWQIDSLGIPSPLWTSSGGSNLGRNIGIAGIGAGTALGVVAGVRQGGLRGGLTAGGSALGGVAALLPLLGVSGPAAPVLMAGALGAGLIASLLPDPKMQRDQQLQRLVDAARYTEPSPTGFQFEAGGGGFDYSARGGVRAITVNVQTMDARSFEDNASRIAGAVERAMQMGHSINRTAREAVLAQ